MEKEIEIVASPSGENVCQFIASVEFTPTRVEVRPGDHWSEAPFAVALFETGDIQELVFEGNRLLVRKSGQTPWPELGKKIGSLIRQFHKTGNGTFFPGELLRSLILEKEKKAEAAAVSINEEKVNTAFGKKVQEILKEKIAPALAAHGGAVSLVDIVEKQIVLNFSGGCQGCAQVSTTVKAGIEQVLKEELGPEIEVVDATDHQSGENPYYK